VAQTDAEIFDLANSYVEKEQYNRAIFVLDKLIEKDGTQSRYYSQKAYTHYLLNEYNKSEAILLKGIERMPDSVGLYISRASLYESTKRYEKAIVACNIALEKTKDTLLITEILIGKATSLGILRDFEQSYQILKEVLNYDPENLSALNNIALTCDEVGRPEETMLYLRRLIALEPESAFAHMNVGFKLQLIGKHNKAIEFFNQAIKLAPKSPFPYNNRAFSQMKLGKLNQAMEDVNTSIAIDSYNSYAYRNKALIYIEKKEFINACKELHTAKRLDYKKFYGDEVDELIEKYCPNHSNKI